MSFVPPHWDTLVSVSVSVPVTVTRLCIGVSWATQSKKKRKNTTTAHLPAARRANEETCPSRSEVPLTDPMLEGARRPPLRPRIAPVGSYNGLLAHKLHCPLASPVATKIFDESGVSTCPKVRTSRTPLNSPLVRIVQALSFSLDRDKSRLRCAVPCSVRALRTEPPVWLALRRRVQAHATRYLYNHQLVQEFPGSRVHAGLSLSVCRGASENCMHRFTKDNRRSSDRSGRATTTKPTVAAYGWSKCNG